MYSVASKNVVRTCSSCTSMIRFRRLDKYVNTKFLADLDLLSNALALQMAGGLRGRSPPHLKSMDKDQNTLASLPFIGCFVLQGACITK